MSKLKPVLSAHWDQEDSHEILEELLHKINPNADISYEECY